MKRMTIIAIALLGFSALHAQTKFSAGVKGGLNFATLEGKNYEEVYDNRTGFHVGAFMTLKAERFGFQPEIMFSTQGALVDLPGIQVEHKLDYINVPLLVKFYPFDFLSISAGPQFGWLTSAVQVGDGTNNVESLYKESDITLTTGIGLELPFGINIEGRYNIGVSDANDNPLIEEVLTNQVYQVSIGFRFFDVGKD